MRELGALSVSSRQPSPLKLETARTVEQPDDDDDGDGDDHGDYFDMAYE